MPSALTVLYQDADLLVADKPAGLVVHRGWADDDVTALDLARQHAQRWVYPAHRLDRGTSGVLVFGLSPDAARSLERAFAEGLVEKRYLALARGTAPEQVRVEHALAKDKGKPKLPAETLLARLEHFVVLDDESGVPRRYSWLEARPITGRPHQIRRHLKHLSHPIIGDVRYGKAEHNRFFRRRFGLTRMVLHAESISLPHPTEPRRLTLNAALPAELHGLLEALRSETAARGVASPTGEVRGERTELAADDEAP